eukprot:m.343405 g.343405  ORF g.343405 m.343405 type:complete len:1268 (+) comp22801_c0_seq1:126-3929(+)
MMDVTHFIVVGMLFACRSIVASPPPAKDSAQYIPFNDDQTLVFLEGENFTTSGNWEAREWAKGPNYFSSTVTNVFHSRRAYLHGPENSAAPGDGATASFQVPAAGSYSVLVRYEAPYRFEVPFSVTVTQHNKPVMTRVYGRRSSLKVWGFSYARARGSLCEPGLVTECTWPWGATENMVWEGVNVTANLAAGPAEVLISPVHDTDYCCFGDRNIDVVMLHPNASDVTRRVLYSVPDGQVLPLDGLFSQLGEVFFQVQNMNHTYNLSVGIPKTYDHSPYMGQHEYLNGSQKYITVPPGKSTGWVEVGGLMDVFNHGTWKISCDAIAPPPPPPPNETSCIIDLREKCPGITNMTLCMECVEKVPCPSPCVDIHGNCTATWLKAACTPPPPPPPPQELQCWDIVAQHCAQNTTGGHHYINNMTKCIKCSVALKPCPKECSIPGPKNTTVCETAWLEAGCKEMVPPRPPPPPRPPAPYKPKLIGPAHCVITVGVKSDAFNPSDKTIAALKNGVYDSVETGTEILFDASTRASRRVRHNEDDFLEIFAQLTAQGKVPGKPPSLVPIYAGTFPSNNDSTSSGSGPAREGYAQKQQEFLSDYCEIGNSCLCKDECATYGNNQNVYLDIRTTNITKLLINNPSVASRVTTVSLGDEISVVGKGNDTTFQAWCTENKITLQDLNCKAWTSCHLATSFLNSTSNPALYYYSSKYLHSAGIQQKKEQIAPMQAKLKNAKFGANFSPTGYYTNPFDGKQYCQNYIGWAFQWIRLFREGGLTLPWGEDWVWQTPVGTQQMMGLSIDAMRSGMYWAGSGDVSETKRLSTWNQTTNKYQRLESNPKHIDMVMYVMKHYPGNTNNSWRRMFFNDIAHGVTRFDLFLFEPSTSGYTCDYVDSDGGAYPAVRAAVNEMGSFEDIINMGSAQANGAAVAILYSETSDIWYTTAGTYGAAQRSLYIALKHAQLPVDMLIEEDCLATTGRLHYYDVLYVALPMITDEAAEGIAAWVAQGGTVYVTAAGGLLNQANKPNTAMETLLGITQTATSYGNQDAFNATIRLIKQDIRFVDILDNVTISNNTNITGNLTAAMPIKGIKSIIKMSPPVDRMADTNVKAPSKYEVLATFVDKSPALLRAPSGKGMVYYAAFMPQLSYFDPAIPLRPVDRSSVDEGMNHFIPTEFDVRAKELLTLPLAGRDMDPKLRPVIASNPLVEVGFVAAEGKGTVLPCINWAGTALANFNVTLLAPVKYTKAVLSSGEVLTVSADKMSFQFNLSVTADAIVLR